MNQSTHSHAAVRVLTYTENGVHNELTAQGGAKSSAQKAGASIVLKERKREKGRWFIYDT